MTDRFHHDGRTASNDNRFLIASNIGAAKDEIREQLWALFSDLAAKGYDDALVFEEVFLVLTDQIYGSTYLCSKEPYRCALERYNQVNRFAGNLDVLRHAMRKHYMANLDTH